MLSNQDIARAVRECLVAAGTSFRQDQKEAYERAISQETNPGARWVLETVLENARLAAQNVAPLCDDTGIPHLFVELGQEACLPAGWAAAVHEGVALGLRQMPGRPMAVAGDDLERIEQSRGLYEDPAQMLPAPMIVKPVTGDGVRLTVLLLGGGPEIRALTHRVFHKRSAEVVLGEAAQWAAREVASLGCTPVTVAIGVGRSHMEASALMLEAMKDGRFDRQSDWEKEITNRVNQGGVGPLGLGGRVTCLATFLKVGPLRASGVRIVCMRPGCCFEPRKATVVLNKNGWHPAG